MPNLVSFGASYISGCSFVFDSISSGCSFMFANIEHAQVDVLRVRECASALAASERRQVRACSGVLQGDPGRTSVREG